MNDESLSVYLPKLSHQRQKHSVQQPVYCGYTAPELSSDITVACFCFSFIDSNKFRKYKTITHAVDMMTYSAPTVEMATPFAL